MTESASLQDENGATHSRYNRIVAAFVLATSATVYFLTMAPTVVFWDVGEFIAAAHLLQVPHPPGSPLFLLTTKLAMMVPFITDLAMRAHAFSALCSAVAIMFVYLVIAKVVIHFHGIPASVIDRVAVYGSGIIGAFALAFSTTYWDNSIEAEVYGVSMLFLTAIMWLAFRWLERSEKPGNEKYFLMIAYLIGLSLGVHLLALLTIFPVLMMIYFRKFEFSPKSFILSLLVAAGVFFVVYPGIVKFFPDMMDGNFRGTHNQVVAALPWFLIGAVVYGVYRTFQKKQHVAHIALLSILLIFIGYTTYTVVLIRANTAVPMNENDPSNLERLTSYLGREQYGNAPLIMPRRYSEEPHQQGIYTNYSNDMDFLWRYQINHMFTRYLAWNFIGREGDYQESGVAWKDTFAIPFLIGLLGLYYQFKRDWKMGLVFLAMFIILGPILALYQNQQEPQPRERDYFYVGAFYVFAVWIALGFVALIDIVKQQMKASQSKDIAGFAITAACLVLIPGNLIRLNYNDKNRSGNYVAWDYSYNILQTCEKDAIIFTNGDNDTFPLWYLQDVEGVRRDVRIVNLSLVNTPWYIRQMRDKPYFKEAKAVPISFTNDQIERLRPFQWESTTVRLPVPEEFLVQRPLERGGEIPPAPHQQFTVQDTAVLRKKAIEWTMAPTLRFGNVNGIKVQDIMVRDIIFTNQWKRPVYFAVTVSPDSKIGLDNYLWYCGLAWRLEPRKIENQAAALNLDILETNLMKEPKGFSTEQQYGYKFRNIANPSVHLDDNATRLMSNYRAAYIRLAEYYAGTEGKPNLSSQTLDTMEAKIPRARVAMGWDLTYYVATLYNRIGQREKYNSLVNEIEPDLAAMIESGTRPSASYYGYNPYQALIDIYETRQEYAKLMSLWQRLLVMYPNDQLVKQRMAETQFKLNSQQPTLPSTKDSGASNQ